LIASASRFSNLPWMSFFRHPKGESGDRNRKLKTQKDGRLFGIELLRKIEAIAKTAPHYTDVFLVPATDVIDGEEFNFPPQAQIVREAFDQIYASASEEARQGFFVDRLGTLYVGRTEISAYEHWEAEGRVREMPPPTQH
jgi:hypothetical protein